MMMPLFASWGSDLHTSVASRMFADCVLHCSVFIYWPAALRQTCLLMTVGCVVISLHRKLSLLGSKYSFIALFAVRSISRLRICPIRRLWLSRMVTEIGFSLHFLYRDLFEIFIGYVILGVCLSCFRYNASRFASCVCECTHMPQFM